MAHGEEREEGTGGSMGRKKKNKVEEHYIELRIVARIKARHRMKRRGSGHGNRKSIRQ